MKKIGLLGAILFSHEASRCKTWKMYMERPPCWLRPVFEATRLHLTTVETRSGRFW